jgi:hypothetical protein
MHTVLETANLRFGLNDGFSGAFKYLSPDGDRIAHFAGLARTGMFADGTLAAGWQVWNATDEKAVLAYRPDVFNGGDFDPACLPTIYVTRGRRTRRPQGTRNLPPDAPWFVTLYLEPDVSTAERFATRAEAVEGAHAVAARFAAGELDYRGLYQVPRENYFAKLDELTGRGRREP